jgi:hypothetical protein
MLTVLHHDFTLFIVSGVFLFQIMSHLEMLRVRTFTILILVYNSTYNSRRFIHFVLSCPWWQQNWHFCWNDPCIEVEILLLTMQLLTWFLAFLNILRVIWSLHVFIDKNLIYVFLDMKVNIFKDAQIHPPTDQLKYNIFNANIQSVPFSMLLLDHIFCRASKSIRCMN